MIWEETKNFLCPMQNQWESMYYHFNIRWAMTNLGRDLQNQQSKSQLQVDMSHLYCMSMDWTVKEKIKTGINEMDKLSKSDTNSILQLNQKQIEFLQSLPTYSQTLLPQLVRGKVPPNKGYGSTGRLQFTPSEDRLLVLGV